jgi:hypothetical protein
MTWARGGSPPVYGREESDHTLHNPTAIPNDAEGTPLGEYLLNEDYEFRMSTLQYDRSTESFYRHARMHRTESDEQSLVLT